jgi:YidC/Oxa1 family membrane protein insertase
MGKKILTLLLWGLAAVFIMQFFFGSGDEKTGDSNNNLPCLESFEIPPPSEYPLILENELVYSEWSAMGASCGTVYLKKYNEKLHQANATEHGMKIFDSKWSDGNPAENGKTGDRRNYRRRDAFRLVESSNLVTKRDPHGNALPNLDSVTWDVAIIDNGLLFSYTSANGVELTKKVVLGYDYHFDATIGATFRDQELLGRTVELEIGTGGGLYIEDDDFYPNPYVGVAVLDHGFLDDIDFENPSADLDGVSRDVTKSWKARNIPFIVEGSKYFISGIRTVGKNGFQGAKYETLMDWNHPDIVNLSGATLPSDAPYWLRASVNGSFSLQPQMLNSTDDIDLQWYIGPKDSDLLNEEAYGNMSELIVYADYERSFFYRIFFTSSVAPAILWLLQMFYGLVGNYGIAIILLTIVVKAAVFPIMRTSQIKMAAYQAKMAVVKPQLDAINKKYADDPQNKNKATMEIYKKHRLSPPIGGCLPMFLQMPIFIGLFQALRSSILLRHESFFGWIDDLSQPDAFIDFGGPIADFPLLSSMTTLNILPIIMVVLWVFHQRLMPKPADPQQAQMQKMMAMMPILFGFILYNYASGLSLYMIVSSAIGIFEQKVIRKYWPVPTAAEINNRDSQSSLPRSK